MHIKICGLTSKQEIIAIDQLGIHYGGIWHLIPRGNANLSEKEFKSLIHVETQNLKLIWVTVENSFAVIRKILKKTALTGIQLHGFQLPSLICQIKDTFKEHVEIFKVIHIRDNQCLEESLIDRYVEAGVDLFIIDTFLSKNHIGSTGVSIDVEFLKHFVPSVVGCERAIIAGGIGEHNIRCLYETIRPYGVDMDSSTRKDGKISKERVQMILSCLPHY